VGVSPREEILAASSKSLERLSSDLGWAKPLGRRPPQQHLCQPDQLSTLKLLFDMNKKTIRFRCDENKSY